MSDKVVLEQVNVLPDRIEARLRIVDDRYRFASPALVAQAIESFPTIPYHACRNQHGPTFASTMERTSVPHLIEHLVIDIQTREHAQEDSAHRIREQAVFMGTTQWSAEDRHVAIVRVSFLDDLIALGAFKKALHFINQALA